MAARHRHDQTVLLGGAQEVAGTQHAAVGVLPPQQGLDAEDGAPPQVDLGLVEEPQLSPVDRAVQLGSVLSRASARREALPSAIS